MSNSNSSAQSADDNRGSGRIDPLLVYVPEGMRDRITVVQGRMVIGGLSIS